MAASNSIQYHHGPDVEPNAEEQMGYVGLAMDVLDGMPPGIFDNVPADRLPALIDEISRMPASTDEEENLKALALTHAALRPLIRAVTRLALALRRHQSRHGKHVEDFRRRMTEDNRKEYAEQITLCGFTPDGDIFFAEEMVGLDRPMPEEQRMRLRDRYIKWLEKQADQD